MNEQQLLTAEQVAAFLQRNVLWVERATRKGLMPAMRLGRIWRYRKIDLDRWVEAQVKVQ